MVRADLRRNDTKPSSGQVGDGGMTEELPHERGGAAGQLMASPSRAGACRVNERLGGTPRGLGPVTTGRTHNRPGLRVGVRRVPRAWVAAPRDEPAKANLWLTRGEIAVLDSQVDRNRRLSRAIPRGRLRRVQRLIRKASRRTKTPPTVAITIPATSTPVTAIATGDRIDGPKPKVTVPFPVHVRFVPRIR